ncbi:MAG: hypothetical protein QNJ19_16545 [Woeseiaceae bacterium]|nr:hypothetical protein [Woeseiaceae bacterium]
MSMLRNVFAVILGIATFFLLIMAVQKIGHLLYAPPTDLDVKNHEQMRAYVATLPVGAILFVGLSYMVGAFGGSVVAAFVGTLKPLYFGVTIGGIVLAFALMNFVIIPHPWWFMLAGPIAIMLASYAAIQLMQRFRS